MLDQAPIAIADAGQPAAVSQRLSAPSTETTTHRKNMALLVQLRWTAVIGQIVTILVTQFWLGITLPLGPMFAVVGALVVLNLVTIASIGKRNEVSNRELFLAVTFDVAALTAQLYLSGGATNPFASLYLLQVTLGAVLLDTRSTWSLVVLTCGCFAGLTVAYRPLAFPGAGFDNTSNLYIAGMLLSFALDAILLVVFVTRINRNLRERDARLAAMRQHAAEEDHIVRMGLLASGAAHELGTPLSSMSVIISDWRRMPALRADNDLVEDMNEMQASLERCKTIVTGILLSAGEARGEDTSATTVQAFLNEVVEEWRLARSVNTLTFEDRFGEDLLIASDAALKQVVFNLLDNAFEASPDFIELIVTREGDTLLVTVSDRGAGFPEDILLQLGKPYQSAKGRPGSGLGLFLVVNVIRKLGGQVVAKNRPAGGASVTITLPLTMLAIGGDGVR